MYGQMLLIYIINWVFFIKKSFKSKLSGIEYVKSTVVTIFRFKIRSRHHFHFKYVSVARITIAVVRSFVSVPNTNTNTHVKTETKSNHSSCIYKYEILKHFFREIENSVCILKHI